MPIIPEATLALKPIVWTHETAIALLAVLQPAVRPFGYHIAMGGRVLNRGFSRKDLDLYFLPLESDTEVLPNLAPDLLIYLQGVLGSYVPIHSADYGGGHASPTYKYKLKFDNGGKRIDAFIA